MFKSAKVNRLSQNIVQQIRDAILTGNLKPGDRLPSEKELAINFGVSKASLREAFRALEALGLLEVRQGMSGGAFVREVDSQTARSSMFNYIFFQNPSIDEFTQLRGFIEPPIAAIAAQKITDGDLIDLEKNLAATEKKTVVGDLLLRPGYLFPPQDCQHCRKPSHYVRHRFREKRRRGIENAHAPG